MTEQDFNHFLKTGFLASFPPATPLETILTCYGNDNWLVKDQENNGLIYGIIMIGMTEFHIYNEKLNGISVKPYAFDQQNDRGKSYPWIAKKNKTQ